MKHVLGTMVVALVLATLIFALQRPSDNPLGHPRPAIASDTEWADPTPTPHTPPQQRDLVREQQSSKDRLRVAVMTQTGTIVEGATVTIGRTEGDTWLETAVDQSNSSGVAWLPAKSDRRCELRVIAHGLVPWSGIPDDDEIVAVLTPGARIVGRVVDVDSVGLSDINVVAHCNADKEPGHTPAILTRPPTNAPRTEWNARTPESLIRVARTSSNGEFDMAGIPTGWTCTVGIDDFEWIMAPTSVTVEAGSGPLILTAHRASGASFRYVSRPTASTNESECRIRAIPAEGMPRSFSIPSSPDGVSLRFVTPEGWRGRVRYTASALISGKVIASGDAEAETGAHAYGILTPEVEDATEVICLVQWADGTVCTTGIHATAIGRDGTHLAAQVTYTGDGLYRLEIPRSSTTLRLIAKDCFRSLDDALSLDLESHPSGQIWPVSMPAGALVAIHTPKGHDVQVAVDGSFGTRTLSVRGNRLLRGVQPGPLSASCTIDGQFVERSIDVTPDRQFLLDFTH